MGAVERMTITMPAELAETLRQTVAGGEYASTSEVVREALRDWSATGIRNGASWKLCGRRSRWGWTADLAFRPIRCLRNFAPAMPLSPDPCRVW